ncbi:hypothetical protein ADICYQ_3992 [Cyclobacterium qasimii M12-11B]|uniref:Uncharacterized protein n=1 Tax=Cyclobacterium qasimii M12-11B TaxID=641524 RepID=S7VC23_9BACT|nr:hypothetical protein ADICYQ_3992 [Cyclobacterium qasimii M12-11B]
MKTFLLRNKITHYKAIKLNTESENSPPFIQTTFSCLFNRIETRQRKVALEGA